MKGLLSWWDLLFPQRCRACDLPLLRGEETFCTRCAIRFPLTVFFEQPKNPIVRIFYGKVKIKFAGSLFFFEKGRPYQNVIHALKYKGDAALAHTLGIWVGERILDSPYFEKMDAVVPVPLHEKRIKMRGYNQSEEVAKGIASVLQIPVWNALVRWEQTDSQTRKAKRQRANNVSHAFGLNPDDKQFFENETLNGASPLPIRLLLVDDVITTGATLEACAKQLNKRNCEIYIATLAYAL